MTPPILKKFDAVAESRKWREASSRRLNAMTREEQDAHLQKVYEAYVARRQVWEQKRGVHALH